jgi:hypothetical protein
MDCFAAAGGCVFTNEDADQHFRRLLEAEKSKTSSDQSRMEYGRLHGQRFRETLALCRREVSDAGARVLDIGRSELTAVLKSYYKDVSTLGLAMGLDDGGHREAAELGGTPHICFDLLLAGDVSAWPQCGRFDLIVFSEVLEHLWVAPEYVFGLLRYLLTDHGVLICTTPNATGLAKRIQLTLGRNPYERLRLYSGNPGHIREYTHQELREIAGSVGLASKSHRYVHWIRGQNAGWIKNVARQIVYAHGPFRPYQLCVFVADVEDRDR